MKEKIYLCNDYMVLYYVPWLLWISFILIFLFIWLFITSLDGYL